MGRIEKITFDPYNESEVLKTGLNNRQIGLDY